MSKFQALLKSISPRQSIRVRLVLIVLAVEILFLALLTMNNLRLLTDSMSTQAEQYVEGQAPVLSSAVLAPLLQRDYATIQSILDEGRGHSNIIYLCVRNVEGKEIAASGTPPLESAVSGGHLVLSHFGKRSTRYDVSMPIIMSTNTLGSLDIGLDINNIWLSIDQFLREGVQILLLGLIVSAALLLSLLHLTVTRHMTEITRGIKELESGNYQHRFTRQSSDELGVLATALNYMSGSVSQSFETLRQSKIDEEERLSSQVEQRTEALNLSNKQLQSTLQDLKTTQSQLIQTEKMATLGQVVANVAHEINTPIGAVKSSGENISAAVKQMIAGFSDLLLSLDETTYKNFFALVDEMQKPFQALSTREERQLNRALCAELDNAGISNSKTKTQTLISLRIKDQPLRFAAILSHEHSVEILRMANQIAKIINGTENINLAIAQVSKIVFALKSFSHTNHTGDMRPANIRDGLETILTIYSNQIKQGVEVKRIYHDVAPIDCFEDELNQVWTNLIHNALQAMQNNGQLTITVSELNNGISVAITDNGPGIPEDIKHKIFDPFFTTKPIGEGSGLGLDIARRIVAKHHGRLDLQSELGMGTTFSVWLPLKPAVLQEEVNKLSSKSSFIN